MTWFEELTGCSKESPEAVREQLWVEDERLHSSANNQSWLHGRLETPSLEQLRDRARLSDHKRVPNSVKELVANVQHLHQDSANANALFQVASQFNLLEMTSPGVTPECGVGIYEDDFTQGPACAIAAGAGTIYRNYFAETNGRIGQTDDNQIDCLGGIAERLENSTERHWKMVNGYALPTDQGLKNVSQKLASLNETEIDQLRQDLRIGLQWETQVTLAGASHTVSQAYCSAMPVAYTRHSSSLWAPLARLVLEAAYEATICAAIVNASRTGNNQLYLTLLGGGAFGNRPDWILSAARRSLDVYADRGLDIVFVSYGSSNRAVQQLANEFS